MGSENGSWQPAFVMSFVPPDKYFFVIINKGISAILKGDHKVQLGEFYDVQYAFNSQAKEGNRAKHLIYGLRPINPLAQVRTDIDDLGRTHVHLTTTAKFEGLVESKNKRVVAKLFNDTFGHFIDLGNMVQQRDKLVEFEFKCKASERDESLSIFVPTRILGYYDLPIEEEPRPSRANESERESFNRNVVGFVCSKTQKDGSRYVWSKDLDFDVRLDWTVCPDEDVTGKWVKVLVDFVKRKVVNDVRVVSDLFESRLYCGVPEVRTEFHFFEFDRDEQIDVYMSSYFGRIRDPHRMIQYNEGYGSYFGYIRFERAPSRESLNYKDRPDSRQSYHSFVPSEHPPTDNRAFYNDSDHSRSQSFQRQNSYSDNEQNAAQEEPSRASSRGQTTSEEDSGDELKNFSNENPRNGVTSDDVVPGSRRQINNESNINGVEDSEDDEEDYQSQRSRNDKTNQRLSRPPITEACTPPRRDCASESSFYATPSGYINSTSQKSSHANTEQQETRRLKLASDKYIATLKYLTNHESVTTAMKMYDLQQYEELKKFENAQKSSGGLLSLQQHSETETSVEVLAQKQKNLYDTLVLFISSSEVSIVMKNYDAVEYEELLKTVNSVPYESSTYSSEEQEEKILKLKCEILILQTQYFAEDPQVFEAWESTDSTKCQFILNELRQ
ncbi:hypothetical protein GCK72_014254 [Caenorhabditis remanei]|uniref:Uncharacterized protein n=1 Tax=Caenorhabditis remanei TaxID=31234 RepID=A0A6A5GRI4_CAERE|nr:hypothetical protein GCK72_014254 [Caenorhabditis remanei]KAF1757797.1 hypothetical protein GCK72_014254 [Caenorhabditis remanei]